jgi:NTP pyrophosphatase (non-canonical NTP hydrolase)
MDILDKIFKTSELDKKTLQEACLKLAEETGEVSEAVLSYTKAHGCAYKNKTANNIIEESLDVIIVAGSIIYKVIHNTVPIYPKEATYQLVLQTLETKLKKWEEKLADES